MPMKKLGEKSMRKTDLEEILEPIQRNQRVQMMKQFIQHGKTSTFQHCRRVAETSDRLNERFRLGADRRVLITAAMLHDFYLYDWHCADDGSHRRHGFHHARRARDNAVREFAVDIRIQSAIDSHMWPLNPLRIPRSREAWILWVADKIVTFREMRVKP